MNMGNVVAPNSRMFGKRKEEQRQAGGSDPRITNLKPEGKDVNSEDWNSTLSTRSAFSESSPTYTKEEDGSSDETDTEETDSEESGTDVKSTDTTYGVPSLVSVCEEDSVEVVEPTSEDLAWLGAVAKYFVTEPPFKRTCRPPKLTRRLQIEYLSPLPGRNWKRCYREMVKREPLRKRRQNNEVTQLSQAVAGVQLEDQDYG